MIPDELIQLIRSLRSLWAIELLLLLHRDSARAWSTDDLVIELRSSRSLVDGLIARLHDLDLIRRQEDAAYRYHVPTPAMSLLVDQLAQLHAERPLTIAQEIHGAPDDKLRAFSDAFRLRKD